MPVTATGISHHVAAQDELAQLNLSAAAIQAGLQASEHVAGFVMLATCNRFEIYFDGPSFHASADAVLAAVQQALPPGSAALVEQFALYPGEAAVEHLLTVTAGLDSMVVGEVEVIGQVRDALSAAAPHITAPLRRLFQAALTTAKAVSTETSLGAAGRSIAAVGLAMVEQRHFPLAGRNALVIGTGSYARVVVAALGRLGCTDIAVYSPSGQAQRFAATHVASQGHPVIPVADTGLTQALAASDVVVGCSAGRHSPQAVLTAQVLAAARATSSTPLPILDLSLPGNVEPAAASLPGIDLINLDEVGAHAPAEQAAAADAARALVTQGVDAYLQAESGRAASPAITAMRAHVNQYVEREIADAQRRYDPDTAAAVARSLHRLAGSLMHGPTLRAVQLAREGQLTHYQHVLHSLFAIDAEAGA